MATTIMPISTRVADLRPMYCARMPSGKRMSAPAKMGIDSIRPFSAAESCRSSVMNGAMAPLSTQMQQEKPK